MVPELVFILRNKFIHIICIPLIMWSAMVFLGLLPLIVVSEFLAISPLYFVLCMYQGFYLFIEPIAGVRIFSLQFMPQILSVPFFFGLAHSASKFSLTNSHAWIVAILVQITSWALQILGHYVFEGRSPAFLKSTTQGTLFTFDLAAFLIAPFFVVIEILFALGYKPALQKKIREKSKRAIGKWKIAQLKSNKKVT